jgi:hypothetical protein
MFLDPLMERWVETAMDAGILPRRADGYPVEWIMPANEPIDPMKDMQADILAVRSGRMTWPQFVGLWGIDPDTQLDEIEDWFKESTSEKSCSTPIPRSRSHQPRAAPRPRLQHRGQTPMSKKTDDDGKRSGALPMQTRAMLPVSSVDTRNAPSR